MLKTHDLVAYETNTTYLINAGPFINQLHLYFKMFPS